MFSNKKFIKFIQKSRNNKCDVICVTILENCDATFQKSIKSMFINSDYDTIGFDLNTELKNHILFQADEIFKNKKGKFVVFDRNTKDDLSLWNRELSINCWVEPFYYEKNYGSIGHALENALNGIRNTLIRSTKHTSVHSFTPNFLENDNSFKASKNLIYERVNTPIRVLLLGDSKYNMEILKNAEIMGWQICFCDVKGSRLKKIKLFDEIILLNSITNLKRVFEKNFDIAVVTDTVVNCNLYVNELLNSEIPNVAIFDASKRVKNLVDFHNMQNNIIIDDRINYLNNDFTESLEKMRLKIENQREEEIAKKEVRDYEFI